MQRAARLGPLLHDLQAQPHRPSHPPAPQATGQACTTCSLGKGQGPQGADWSSGHHLPTRARPSSGAGPGSGWGRGGQLSSPAKHSAGADSLDFPCDTRKRAVAAPFEAGTQARRGQVYPRSPRGQVEGSVISGPQRRTENSRDRVGWGAAWRASPQHLQRPKSEPGRETWLRRGSVAPGGAGMPRRP